MSKLAQGQGGDEAISPSQRLAVAVHVQAIEANPLLPSEVAMFEMFERDEWSPEDRRAFMSRQFVDLEDIATGE